MMVVIFVSPGLLVRRLLYRCIVIFPLRTRFIAEGGLSSRSRAAASAAASAAAGGGAPAAIPPAWLGLGWCW
jgi:hypothetical protein